MPKQMTMFGTSPDARRRAGRKPKTGQWKACKHCGKKCWQVPSDPRRFCSRTCTNAAAVSCASEYRKCRVCGIEYRIKPSQRWNRALDGFCSRRCMGDGRIARPLPRQHNGRCARLDQSGYVMLWEPSHPRSIHGWVPEHRLVVEWRVGRVLRTDEQVHHVNGIKHDNRDENLIVLAANVHAAVTAREQRERRTDELRRLAEYERRFGPLDTDRAIAPQPTAATPLRDLKTKGVQ